MSNDVKLPTTVEEYQRERRQAFERGAITFGSHPYRGEIEEEARKRYPLPKKKVARGVRHNGHWYRTNLQCADEISVQLSNGRTVHFEGRDVEIMRDLIARPYDEVDV